MSALSLELSLPSRVQELALAPASLCYQCGVCTAACPMRIPVRRILRAAQLGAKEMAIGRDIWYCAMCRLCEAACPRGVKITSLLRALRVLGFEERRVPPRLEQALWGVYEDGNPWGGKRSERALWAEGLGIKRASDAERVKYLLYVGCAVSFDKRLHNVARSLGRILTKLRLDVGIMGSEEKCCGDVVYQSGEEGFLEEVAQENIERFKRTGAEVLVTISPHCLSMFRNIYPRFGEMPEVLHYTELLTRLLDQDKLKVKRSDGPEVTYHDPCYLGRYHGIYEEPRRLLEETGARLVEMTSNRENALCCGGGGGLMWMEMIGERPSHRRVEQAAETGAGIMATSCPYCVQNFEDAVKTTEIGGLRIMELLELLEPLVEEV